MQVLPALVAVAGLAVVHLIAGKLRFLEGIPRSRWLSIAGGISVAYVVMHLLPELSEAHETVERTGGELLAAVEHHVYLVALLGLVVFYGLERLAAQSRAARRAQGEADATGPAVFWLHIASFGGYNALIGYLLVHREQPGLRGLLLFFIAMGLHFVVTDYGLYEHHKDAYRRLGRWALAGAIVLGWALGVAADIGEAAVAVLVAFLAGGIILNVLKEELPQERESRFWAFSAGAAAYAALLIAL